MAKDPTYIRKVTLQEVVKKQCTENVNKLIQQKAIVVTLAARKAPNSLESRQKK